MKKIIRQFALMIVTAATVLLLLMSLSSCGSELDGTWTSCEDEDTRIKISGEKVKITYVGNTTGSTYEYKIDGKKLIIKDSFGKDVEYTKK